MKYLNLHDQEVAFKVDDEKTFCICGFGRDSVDSVSRMRAYAIV